MNHWCDACHALAPDVVGPILHGQYKWAEFEIDGEKGGRPYEAKVLLCPDCAKRMQAFVDSGGRAGEGPKPPDLRTLHGGRDTEPRWLDVARAA